MANLENIAKVRDFLATERPVAFDMEHWRSCVAGFACQVLGLDPGPLGTEIEHNAASALGLDRDTQGALFDAITDDGVADLDIAIERLDALLAGNEIER